MGAYVSCRRTPREIEYVCPRSESFKVLRGLVPGTEESCGEISLDRPNRQCQWDYICAR